MSGWSIRLDPARWHPEQHVDWTSTARLAEGQIVIYERKPHRILGVRDREQDRWPDAYRDLWVKQGMPDPATWWSRPIAVLLRPEPGEDSDRIALLVRADYTWWVLPEHFSVCRLCNEIPPCTHVHNEKVMAYAVERLGKDMELVPGACLSCHGPISARQKTIVFEGENLTRPDFGDGSAIFHVKQSCRSDAEAYDKRWAKAAPGRRRKLFCEGHGRHHYDGSFDCSEPACPGKVSHRSNEYHSPDAGRLTSGCWCVSGDLTARIEQQMRDGETAR